MFFPGVETTYDFPLGAVSVFVDTDAHRAGPEYGHFMDFFSDYRFALTDHWRENPTPEWGHSPEGACVETAGVRSDKQSKLRWFQYIVRKTEGCFEAESVRVAVTTINTGDLKPITYYDRPFFDHLGAKHTHGAGGYRSPDCPTAGTSNGTVGAPVAHLPVCPAQAPAASPT